MASKKAPARPDAPAAAGPSGTSASTTRARSKAAAMREVERRKFRRRRLLKVLLAVVVVLAVGGGITGYVLTRPAPPSLAGVKTFTGLGRNHTNSNVTYPQIPPVGGDHSPIWLNCGIYSQPVPNVNAVHSLEHGAVWITYQPSLSPSAVDTLQNDVRGKPYVILSPYPGLPAPVVASAWGKQLTLTGANDPRLAQFIKTYVQGPQTPEPGASCTGGTGSPQ